MSGKLAAMTIHEKHGLLVTALWGLVVLPAWAEVVLYPAFRVAAATEVHLPTDVLRTGPILAGISAVIGSFIGIGVGALAPLGQVHHKSWVDAVGTAGLFLLLGGALFSAMSLLMLRRGFVPPNPERERDRLGPAAWWRKIRWLQLEPHVSATEQQDFYRYAGELTARAEENRKDSTKISGKVLGFVTFLRLYFGNREFRTRNGVRLVPVCCCGLACVAAVSTIWLLAGTWFSSRVLVPSVSGEILLWLILRWRYEYARLVHMADARDNAAREIHRLAGKKVRLQTGAPAGSVGHAATGATALGAATGIVVAWMSLSHWRRRARGLLLSPDR